jgi:hypothetical protein
MNPMKQLAVRATTALEENLSDEELDEKQDQEE